MNILESWKQSLSLFAPANFVPFIKQVGKSTGSLFLALARRWYLWIIPVAGLLLQGVITQHLIMRFLVKVYPTIENPNVLWFHVVLSISGLVRSLMYLWLFGFVYQTVVLLRFGAYKKSLFVKYAPVMIIVSVLCTLLLYSLDTFFAGSSIGDASILAGIGVYNIVLYLFVASWILLEEFYLTVLYARHLTEPATGVLRSFVKTVRDIIYLFPALFVAGGIFRLLFTIIIPEVRGFITSYLYIDSIYISVPLYWLLFPIVINFWVNFYEWQFKRQPVQ